MTIYRSRPNKIHLTVDGSRPRKNLGGAPPKNYEIIVKTPLDLIGFHLKKYTLALYVFFITPPFYYNEDSVWLFFTISFILRNIPKMLMNLKNFNYRNSCVVMG